MKSHLKISELKMLPFTTLSVIAMSVAKEIQEGATEKRDLLEQIFDAMGVPKAPQ